MTDRATEVSADTQAAVRAVLRGERASMEALDAQEANALVTHGVAPLLYSLTKAPALRAAAIREAAIEPYREADLRHVLGALGARGVECLILKGTALAYDLYGSPELRPRADTDLLIRRDALEEARRALVAAGCVEAISSGDEHGLRQTAFSRTDANGIEHEYDVHWAVSNKAPFAALLTFGDAWPRSIAIPRLGPFARGLCPVDALLLACVHRIAHHHDDDRMIWLVDIALLRARMTAREHEEFWTRAADAGVVAICERSIELADALYSRRAANRAGDWLPPERLETRETTAVFLDRDLTHGDVLAAGLRALPPRERVQRLWQLAFPPSDFMRSQFGVRNRLALPFFYALRAARGVVRLFRRAAP